MDLPVDTDHLAEVLRGHGVVFASVYGSHATGAADEGSDVDLAVWADGPVDDWGLRGALPDVIDLLDLHRAPDGPAGRVAMEGIVVFDDEPNVRIRWQADTRKRHLDEAFRRERFRQDVVRAHGRPRKTARYADVDDRLVVGHLDDLGELRAFVAAMTRLLG